ncbi:MAG: hypothetical protein ACOWYE_14395 [Desulfatiglandales bacterium]
MPYLEMWAAVLDQAVKDALGCGCAELIPAGRQRIMDESMEWILSESTEPGSLRWVSALFEVRPETMRQRILKKVKHRRLP